ARDHDHRREENVGKRLYRSAQNACTGWREFGRKYCIGGPPSEPYQLCDYLPLAPWRQKNPEARTASLSGCIGRRHRTYPGIWGDRVGTFRERFRWAPASLDASRRRGPEVFVIAAGNEGRTHLSYLGQVHREAEKRKDWLAGFKYYLLFSLFVAAPVILILDSIFIRPFSKKRILVKKQHYLA